MNPHADSVQQEAEEYAAFKDWRWKTSSVDPWDAWKARAALARFGTRPAAEPVSDIVKLQIEVDEASQSGSAGEAGQPWTMEVVAQLAGYPARAAEPSNLLLAAAVEALEFAEDHSDVADGPDGQPQANRAMLLAETLRAALSRQAPAAPAEAGEGLIERLKQEARIHAQEARTANATIAEIYQIVTGKTGEPGNWNGAEPVRKCIEELRSRLPKEQS